MAKEIDRVRAQSALAVIKQHPGMVLFAVSPVIIALGLVWWFVSPALAVLLLIGAVVGGGASRFIKKALTGEGLPLMRCQGQGDVFLAERAYDVHLLNLNNAGLSISGKNVLAFSSSLDWNIERVKGGSMVAGGLFNTTLRGTGWVALTTDGPPVVLNAAEAPTFADTNAVVAWSANLQTQLKTSFKAGALIGRGSGEALQVSFYGPGFVIVQPSEGIQPVATG